MARFISEEKISSSSLDFLNFVEQACAQILTYNLSILFKMTLSNKLFGIRYLMNFNWVKIQKQPPKNKR